MSTPPAGIMSTPARITLILLLILVGLLLVVVLVLLLLLAARTARSPSCDHDQKPLDYEVNPLNPTKNWYEPFDLLTFQIETEDYLAFMEKMNRCLVAGSQNQVGNLPMMRKQNPKWMPPARWLILEVRSEYTKIMLALRQDNLHITGFTNTQGYWYIFGNLRSEIMLGAIPLRINGDYGSLVGGFENLATIRMSRLTLYDALNEIAAFLPPGPRDLGCISRALAIMAVTFAEASRFKDIQAIVNEGLRNNLEGADIRDASKLVVHWKDLSCAILIANQKNNGKWDSTEALIVERELGIENIDDAMANLNVLLWPQRCTQRIYGLVG